MLVIGIAFTGAGCIGTLLGAPWQFVTPMLIQAQIWIVGWLITSTIMVKLGAK